MKRLVAQVFLVLLGGLLVAFFSAQTASADTHVCVGGFTDTDSQLAANVKAAQGDPCDVKIKWPAALGLPGESTNVQGSLDVGVPNTVKAYYDAGGGNGAPVRIEGLSEGAIAASQSGDAIRIQHGGVIPPNLTVVTDGNPYGDSGLQNDPGVAGFGFDVAKPFLGLPQDVPQMGINRNGVFDFYGNGANQLPQTQIAMLSTVAWNHIAPDPATSHDTYVTHDPVTGADVQNEIYNPTGEQNPISAAAQVAGTPVDPVSDAFFDVGFPVNNPADPSLLTVHSDVPLLTVHSDLPSFPGELPCPGGYFTPGDMGC